MKGFKDKLYDSKEVTEIVGISSDCLSYWRRAKRIIIPKIEWKGRGRVNKYSYINLLELAVIKTLRDIGIELNYMEAYMSKYKKELLIEEDFCLDFGDIRVIIAFCDIRKDIDNKLRGSS